MTTSTETNNNNNCYEDDDLATDAAPESTDPASAGVLAPYADVLRVLAILPELVREARRRHGLSLQGAAEVLDMSKSNVTRFEQSGRRRLLSIQAFVRFAGDLPPGDDEDVDDVDEEDDE